MIVVVQVVKRIPTYRASADGLWNQFVVAEVATAQAIKRHPKKVWEWIQVLAQTISTAAPNAGHLALANLEQHCKVTVVTQNVDNLHERAGSTEVIHLHGSLWSRSTRLKHPSQLGSLRGYQHWRRLRCQSYWLVGL